MKACLCHYRYYLIGLDHEQYVECWDGGCPFKDLCEQIIWDLEEICTFTISASVAGVQVPEHECVNRIFRTEQAQKLLARLSPEYCRNGHWVKEAKKAFICQVAHVLSGLLEIPDSKKWIYFEKYWGVTGLAQAWAGRNGKGLDAEIDMLYPEMGHEWGTQIRPLKMKIASEGILKRLSGDPLGISIGGFGWLVNWIRSLIYKEIAIIEED